MQEFARKIFLLVISALPAAAICSSATARKAQWPAASSPSSAFVILIRDRSGERLLSFGSERIRFAERSQLHVVASSAAAMPCRLHPRYLEAPIGRRQP